MNNKQKINILLNTIKENKEGFTLKYSNLKPYNLNKGYAVGITNIKSKYPLNAVKQVLSCIKGFSQIKNKLYVGGWFNPEDSYFYLDLSLILENEDKSKILGNVFNQIAYFRFKDFQTINLK